MMTGNQLLREQYGREQVPQLDVPNWLLRLLNRFGISRALYISSLLKSGDRLLDLGCGNADLLRLIQNKFALCVGVDVIRERLRYAQTTTASFHLLANDLNQAIPFRSESFDCVTALHTLEWVYDLNQCLRETNRVLKPEGQFILQVSNLGFFWKRFRLLFGFYPKTSAFAQSEWPRIGWDSNACHMFTKKELIRFLKAFGFTVKKVTGTGIFYSWRNWWPSLLCGDLILLCQKEENNFSHQ